MKRLIIRLLLCAALMGTGAYGSLAYTAAKYAPKTVTENRYVRCVSYLQKVRSNPVKAYTSKRSRAKQRRCSAAVRRFERKHAGRAKQLVGKARHLSPADLF